MIFASGSQNPTQYIIYIIVMFFNDSSDFKILHVIREKPLVPEFADFHDAASNVFAPEMDNTCSQLHVGSGFLKKD